MSLCSKIQLLHLRLLPPSFLTPPSPTLFLRVGTSNVSPSIEQRAHCLSLQAYLQELKKIVRFLLSFVKDFLL